jgi:hypothetical protein
MQIINQIPLLLSCLKKWESCPTEAEFDQTYLKPMEPWLAPMLEDFGSYGRPGMASVLTSLNWKEYREEAMRIDAANEEKRLRAQIEKVESLLGVSLKGEAVLFGAFTLMDGYARFDRGGHRVFLGVDESHGRGLYLDILISHELTHVARESQPTVWQGFGLDPLMTHDQFAESQPVIEHLFSEGFSCVVSEILNPCRDIWNYVYQSKDTLEWIYQHGPGIDRVVHAAIAKKKGDYRSLYNVEAYQPQVPRFAHYVWAWQWVKELLRTVGGSDPRSILKTSSIEFREHALGFKLTPR